MRRDQMRTAPAGPRAGAPLLLPPGRWRPLALLPVAALALSACGQEAPAQTEGPTARPVQVTVVVPKPRAEAKTFVGVVRARREIDLAFRVSGKVVQRLVEVGDRVEPGTVIASIDAEDLTLELESARAELAAARANLAQTDAENARYSSLTAKGVASAADRDRKVLAREEAVGRLERAKRSLDLAQNRVGYATLVSDAAGVVISTSAEPGQVVSTGQTIVRVARLDEKEALVALPETALADARAARAGVTLWAEPGRSFPARLRELSPQADVASRTYPARFTIDGADDTVALGMTAMVTLTPAGAEEVVMLPLSAVLDRGHGPHVFVVEEKTHALVLKPVEVARYTEEAAIISSGLAAGEKVVTMGVQTLEPGRLVRTVATR